MSTYEFNRSMADNVRDDMARVTKQLQTELANLDSQVKTTLADWVDGAKTQYDSAKAQWDAAAARMPASLAAAEKALNDITDGYLRIEHTGVNQWGGYSVR